MGLMVDALDHLVLNVRDVELSAAWYQSVLGMVRHDSKTEKQESRTAVKFGRQKINLRPVTATKDDWFTAENVSAGSGDLCFLTESAPLAVLTHLSGCGVALEKGPVHKEGALGTLISIYCRDPDGNLIEISSYENV